MTAISLRAAPPVLRFGLSILASLLLHVAVFWPLGAFLQHLAPVPMPPLEVLLLAAETPAPEPAPAPIEAEPALAEDAKPPDQPLTPPVAVPPAPTLTPKPPKPPEQRDKPLPTAKLEQAKQEFYPREAIARGLEGDVVVLLTLTSSGGVADASVATSSGHAILDAAALNAVRHSGELPAGQRQLLLAVQFRLD